MLENKMCFIIAAIICNKDMLGTLGGCVLFLTENPTKMSMLRSLYFCLSQRYVL